MKTYYAWGDSPIFELEGNAPPRPPNEFERLILDALEQTLMEYVNEQRCGQ